LPRTRVRSMTSVFSMNTFLDLEKIATSDRLFEYDPAIYPGVIYRLKEPRIGFLIFSTGKVVCTGGRTIEEVRIAIEKLWEKLRQAGLKLDKVPEPKICNIVATAELDQVIDIELFASKLSGAVYEPEQFPAVIFRPNARRVVALVFSSGKIVITGAKTITDLEHAYDRVQEGIALIGFEAK